MSGPLTGLRVVELAAIGPVPFCGMLLADMGADVIRVDKPHSDRSPLGDLGDVCGRGKRSLIIDLKDTRGAEVLLEVIARSDVVLEGMRPGVAERLGVGPAAAMAANPGVVYGRMTGWGRDGPMAAMAGHDINYISLVGALHAIGGAEPVVPLNLVADYGGGALYLAMGVLAALYERAGSGSGQVVDAAMIDGAASLMTPTYQLAAAGLWRDQRQANVLDGAAPFYRTYRTSDDGYVAVGALEPKFYSRLLEVLGIDESTLPLQFDQSGWPEVEARFAAAFAAHPRLHWETIFDGEDACVTPVLSLEEAPRHAHNRARKVFMNHQNNPQPAPAPRFTRTPCGGGVAAPAPGEDTEAVLGADGFSLEQIARLAAAGVIGVAP